MQEICYFLADDGKKFEDRWECIEYEKRKALEAYKDKFQFYDYHKDPIPIEEATTDEVSYIVVKSESCTEAISDWFNNDGCEDPFDGICCDERIGTWVHGDLIDKGDEWFKLELEIKKLQTLINEVNQ